MWSLSMLSIQLLLVITFGGREVQSHGYLESPRARNYIAWKEGVWSGGSSTSYPKEDCPHCANIGGTAGQCGVIGSKNYDQNLNVLGEPMAFHPQARYSQGQVIDLDVVLTAHHMGHFEFSACPIPSSGGVATGECFSKYPLEFVEDPLYGAPKDSNYPNRAYIATPGRARSVNTGQSTGTFYRFRMKLPDNLIGDSVLLQWHYYTANSCVYPGYSSYAYPSDWGSFQTGTGICDNIPSDGRGLPEQFWNCAEISISDGPVAPSTTPPIPAPSMPTPTAPTSYPPSPNTPSSNGASPDAGSTSNCGDGKIGNGKCSDSSLCCSHAGFCGTGEAYCGSSTPSPTTASRTSSPTPSPTRARAPTMEIAVTPIPFPDYADGACSNVDNVMSVNLGYYQSWAIFRDSGCNPVTPIDIDVYSNQYTHLVYTFASINSNFEIEAWGGNYDAEAPQYLVFNALKDIYPDLKTMIAVGGWTFNDPGETQTRFSDTASTESSRATFAASCVEFCRKYKFDGIDLDWEYPGDSDRGGTSADYTNYGLLVQAIRAAFDDAPEDLELSIATAVARSRLESGYDLVTMAKGADFFNLMTYDIHGPWESSKQTGANSDMPYIFEAIQYILETGIAPDKLVLGLAAYGHSFELADASQCSTMGCTFSAAGSGGCAGAAGFMPYFTIDEYVRSGTYNSLSYNENTGTMELVVDESTWISYDNKETFEMKYDFASKACFRGIMWWAVDMLVRSILLGSNDPPADAPTTTTASTSSPLGSPTDTSPSIPPTPSSDWKDWVVSLDSRCGTSELDARGNCRPACVQSEDCDEPGHSCWRVHANFCGSKPDPEECGDDNPSRPHDTGLRCGPTEVVAREICGTPCKSVFDCDVDAGEYCFALNPNFCNHSGCNGGGTAGRGLLRGAT